MAALALAAGFALAQEIVTTTVVYQHGDTTLEGYLARPAGDAQNLPAVIIVHDWNGLDAYERSRADMLAREGYVAFALDIYGQGVRPRNTEESAAQARRYYADLDLFLGRMNAGLSRLREFEFVDGQRVAAMGYCFGGSGVLEWARSGVDLQGVVSFHGGLGTSRPAEEGAVTAKVMVFHAYDDFTMERETLGEFLNEMSDAGVDYQVVVYNLEAHSFTVPGSAQYDENADARSWGKTLMFFGNLLGAR